MIRNLKIFAMAAVAVALLWGVFGFVQSQQKESEVAAFSALSKVESLEARLVDEAEVLTEDPFEALLDAGEEAQQEYISLNQAVLDDHAGTTASFMAALRLGRLHGALGQWDEAIEHYSSLKSQVSNESAFYVMATEGLAKTYLAQENFEAALQAYEGTENVGNTLQPLLLMGKAKVMLEMERSEEATELFQRVISDYPSTPYSREAQALKAKAAL